MQSARDEILGRLKAARKTKPRDMPDVQQSRDPVQGKEEMIRAFTGMLRLETGIVHRVENSSRAKEKLTEIAKEEGLKRVMVSTDDVVAPLDLPAWGNSIGVQVMRSGDFAGRDDYKDAVFDIADAGITGADFAVAESGTLGLILDRDQPRLISLAPILHIAIVPVDRIFSVYEQVMERVFKKDTYPGQFVFITGPSMTGDIQGHLFKGIHGPRKVIVILVG